MPTETDLSKLAVSLSEAQRAAILNACMTHPNIGGEPFVTIDYTDPWTVPGLVRFVSLSTDRLTPLGQQLRAHLQGNDRE